MPRRAPARATLASRTLAAATLGALLAPTMASSRAAAANVTVQVAGTASAGWTDNVVNAPDEPTTMGSPRQSDVLFQLAPRGVLLAASPRLLQRLAYNFTADLFARHPEASSYSNTLDWTGNLATSPTTQMILTLTSLQGKVSTFSFNQTSSGATVAVLPQNSNIGYFNQVVGESLEARPIPDWRIAEQLRFSAFIPLDRGALGDSYDLVGELGFDRVFVSDAIGMTLRADFVDFVVPRDPTTDVPIGFDQRQLLTSLVGRWRHDWGRFWSTEAAAGAIAVVGASKDPTAKTFKEWDPTGFAALRWSKDIGSAELSYSHDVTPNALAGNTFTRDSATLQAGVPFVRAKMFFGATGAYQHAHALTLVGGMPPESAHVVLADATIGWQPIPELGVFARYSYFKQYGSPPINDKPALLPDLTRNTVMVGVNVLYPATTRMRVASRPGSRVDAMDQAAFPELHAPEPR